MLVGCIKMTDFETSTGIYLGKVLVKEGKKKDGKGYKNWKLSFKPYEDSVKSFGLTYFQNDGTEFPTIQEGKWYTMSVAVRPYTNQYGDQKSKNIFKIEEGKKETTKTPQQQIPSAAPTKEFNSQQFVEFQQEYDIQMKDNAQKNAMHMLGAYIANYHAVGFEKAIELCKYHFKPK